MSDDCLHLNVYTLLMPNASKSEKANLKTVIAYVGGFMLESGGSNTTLEGPEYLLDYDVLLVTINYRLGILGFMATKEISGNNGLKDQQMALRWIRDNIEDYGGDPNSVTFMGWSGGARSVSYHTRSESSEGLFHRAIMMSGYQPYHVDLFRRNIPYIQIEPILKTAALVGCNQTHLDEQIECLRYTSSRKLGKTFHHMRDEFYCPEISWRVLNEPNLGQENFGFINNLASTVPTLTGFVKDELLHHAVVNYEDKKRLADWTNRTAFNILLEKCFLASSGQFDKPWNSFFRGKSGEEFLQGLERIYSGVVKNFITGGLRFGAGKGYHYINTYSNGFSNFSYEGSKDCKLYEPLVLNDICRS
jgi:carboxylesterase type B